MRWFSKLTRRINRAVQQFLDEQEDYDSGY